MYNTINFDLTFHVEISISYLFPPRFIGDKKKFKTSLEISRISYLHKVKWNHSHWEVSQLLTVSNTQMLNVTIEYFGKKKKKNRGEIPLFWILILCILLLLILIPGRYLKFRISVSTKNWRYPKFMKVFSLDETATAVHDKNVQIEN